VRLTYFGLAESRLTHCPLSGGKLNRRKRYEKARSFVSSFGSTITWSDAPLIQPTPSASICGTLEELARNRDGYMDRKI